MYITGRDGGSGRRKSLLVHLPHIVCHQGKAAVMGHDGLSVRHDAQGQLWNTSTKTYTNTHTLKYFHRILTYI